MVRGLSSERDLTFGIGAYLGVAVLSHLRRDRTRTEPLRGLATRVAVLADALLAPRQALR
jgi:hypothetical protein